MLEFDRDAWESLGDIAVQNKERGRYLKRIYFWIQPPTSISLGADMEAGMDKSYGIYPRYFYLNFSIKFFLIGLYVSINTLKE